MLINRNGLIKMATKEHIRDKRIEL